MNFKLFASMNSSVWDQSYMCCIVRVPISDLHVVTSPHCEHCMPELHILQDFPASPGLSWTAIQSVVCCNINLPCFGGEAHSQTFRLIVAHMHTLVMQRNMPIGHRLYGSGEHCIQVWPLLTACQYHTPHSL